HGGLGSKSVFACSIGAPPSTSSPDSPVRTQATTGHALRSMRASLVVKIHFLHPAIGKVGLVLHDGSSVLLGRSGGGAGIELNWDHRISRKHATISVSGREVWFEDWGSANGSWHAGTRIKGRIRFE